MQRNPRNPAQGDFQVPVDGIGEFTFGRRTQGDIFRIRGDYVREGGMVSQDGMMSDLECLAYCTINVLAVAVPTNFKLDVDPLLVDGWGDKLVKVMTALNEKESSFRQAPGAGSQAVGS